MRYYKKKTTRRSWDDAQMQLAVTSVLQGKNCKAAAIQFGVPRTTLYDKLKLLNNPKDETIVKKVVGFSCVFDTAQEAALAAYVNGMETQLIGLSAVDIRRLAFEYAERLKIKHSFNRDEGLAGKDWLKGFCARHALSNRKPENTSAARARGFNKESVTEFFTLLEEVLQKYNFTPNRIWNVDETGVSAVPKSSPRVIARKGKKQVGGKSVAERGETVTAQICMSAAGVFMPPMLIFPRVKENPDFLKDAPPGAWAEFHRTGYMQMDLMYKWGVKFAEFTGATPDNPVLLILDGHVTHVKNLKFIDFARENGIIILCLPPHCTHKMQPLDVGFMAPLNSAYGKEIAALHQQHSPVNTKNLFSIFGRAFLKAAKMETAVNAFKKCGIQPFNPSVFSEEDFVSSKRDAEIVPSTSTLNNSESEERVATFSQVVKDVRSSILQPVTSNNSPSQSAECRSNEVSITTDTSAQSQIQIPLADVIQAAQPLLKLLNSYSSSSAQSPLLVPQQDNDVSNNCSTSAEPNKKPARARGKAAVITDDKYKENLMAEKIKNMKKEKAEATKSQPKTTTSTKKCLKRKVTSDDPVLTKTRKPLSSVQNELQIRNVFVRPQPLQVIAPIPSIQENQFIIPNNTALLNYFVNDETNILNY